MDSTKLSNMIAKSRGTPLELVAKMTFVTNRIHLKSAKAMFDSLRKRVSKSNFQSLLPVLLMVSL